LVAADFLCLFFKALYLTNEHQPDRTTSETPYFCYSHLLAKFNIGAPDPTNTQKPDLTANRSAGTDQQDEQLSPDYYDVRPHLQMPLCRPFAACRAGAVVVA
jgi:hypothetical protein